MNFDGSESIPDLNKATFLAFDDNAVPIDGSWIAEWRYPSGVVTRRIANRQGHTNIIFKMKLDPVPAGDACTTCWGIDKPFGSDETPSIITVVFADIEKGPGWIPIFGEPPNGAFELTQDPGGACRYIFENADFLIPFSLGPSNSSMLVFNKPAFETSFFDIKAICNTFFENTVAVTFIGGTATIFVPPVT